MSNFPDIMVDIETTGTSPDHGAIIQLAAVKFNLLERTVDATDLFDRCLEIPAKRWWDEGTREFWMKQPRHIIQGIYSRMEDPLSVMTEFGEWVGYSNPEPPRFWGKPTHFDYSFIASYFNQFGVLNPFHYRYARDMNSFISGLYANPDVQKIEVEFQGDVHNAIFDVLHQIQTLFEAMDRHAPAALPALN